MNIYKHNIPLTLESGEKIDGLEIAYHTFGTLNAERNNIIWVCHALTANSDVADWWQNTVVPGGMLDPERYFIVCANVLGSCYGTTGPLSINPATGKPYYGTFPQITVRDIVACNRILAKHLNINRVKMLIGSSLGGFQCMEWAITDPDFTENLMLIATAATTTPWAAGFNESQRMAIEADQTYGNESPDAGAEGMSVARSIALLSYRGADAYNATQQNRGNEASAFAHRVHSYQRHQGEKLKRRFNAYSYYRLTQVVDSHNVGRNRGPIADVLKGIKARTHVIAISSDILFPPADHEVFINNIPDVRYTLINSEFGHDGFLVEHEYLTNIVKKFLNDRDETLETGH